jgi:hypothetical protein
MSNTIRDSGLEIKVTLGSQYGQRTVHPACDKSEIFCTIAGTKLLTPRLIEQIKRLGYKVTVIPTEPSEL